MMITRMRVDGLVNNSVMNLLGAGNLFTTGRVIYVDSVTGSNGNTGLDPAFPLATIAQAQTNAKANKGDTVVIFPTHAETYTAAVTLSKAGVSYVGLGEGMNRPTITVNGTVDGFSITGANVIIANIIFPAPVTDAQTADINVAAAGAKILNTYHIGSAGSENKVDIITVASGGHDLIVNGVRAYNTVVDCVSWLSLEAAVNRPIIANCVVMGQFSTGVLIDEATATLCTITGNIFKNTKAATAVVTFTTGNSTGVMDSNFCSGRHTTIASNIVPGTGMDFNQNFVVEEAALNGILIPVADAD